MRTTFVLIEKLGCNNEKPNAEQEKVAVTLTW